MATSAGNRGAPASDSERSLRDLQDSTLEMTLAWIHGEWGADSTQNFARYMRWLLPQLEPAAPADESSAL